MHPLRRSKLKPSIFFLCVSLWWCTIGAPQEVYATHNRFWSKIRLRTTFALKPEHYTTQVYGMHPSYKPNELKINYRLSNPTEEGFYRIRWYHAPSIHFNSKTKKEHTKAKNFDQLVSFTGKGLSLCGQLAIILDLSKIQIGAGIGIRCAILTSMVGKWGNGQGNGAASDADAFEYRPPKPYYITLTPLCSLGYKLLQRPNYTLLWDVSWLPQLYRHTAFGKSYYWTNLQNIELGISVEKHFSRYLSGNLRLAYGFLFHQEVTESSPTTNRTTTNMNMIIVTHRIDRLICQLGMSIGIPSLPRCNTAGCATILDHKHNGKAYRGDGLLIPYPEQ